MAGDDAGRWPGEVLPATWCWVDFTTFFSDFTDSHRKVPQKQYKQKGALAVVDQGAARIGGYTDDLSMLSSAPLPAIVFGDHTRAVKYIDIPFAQGADGVRVLAPNDHTEPAFAYQALRCLELPDKGYSRHFKFLKASRFPLPPLSEQRRIVAKIDSLTGKSRRARDHLDHIPRLVEKYKQAVLAAAFRGDLTRDWRRDQPRPLSVAGRQISQIRQKYVEAGDFHPPYDVPAGWRWHRLPQLGDLDRGKSRHRPRNDKRLFGGPYPFVQTGEVRHADRFLTTFQETYSDFGLAQSKLWPVGTICITIAANIAETAILGIDACFPDSVVGFLPDADKVDASYVEFFLRTARGELEAFAPATAQKNINLDTLATVRVPAAPLVEQIEIVSRIERAFVWIDRLASEATSARRLIDRLDQAVLAKAFRGELVPQDPEDEPASVLLDRIRAERGAAPKAKSSRKSKAAA